MLTSLAFWVLGSLTHCGNCHPTVLHTSIAAHCQIPESLVPVRSAAAMMGPAMLKEAVAAYQAAAAAPGLEVLQSGVLYTTAHRAMLAAQALRAPDALMACHPQLAFNVSACREHFFPHAYTIPAWTAVHEHQA